MQKLILFAILYLYVWFKLTVPTTDVNLKKTKIHITG